MSRPAHDEPPSPGDDPLLSEHAPLLPYSCQGYASTRVPFPAQLPRSLPAFSLVANVLSTLTCILKSISGCWHRASGSAGLEGSQVKLACSWA